MGERGSEGFPFEALAIAVILLLNAALGVWQERIASTTGGSSMANYAELMTVQQRIDLVAFLLSSYSTKDEVVR